MIFLFLGCFILNGSDGPILTPKKHRSNGVMGTTFFTSSCNIESLSIRSDFYLTDSEIEGNRNEFSDQGSLHPTQGTMTRVALFSASAYPNGSISRILSFEYESCFTRFYWIVWFNSCTINALISSS